MPKLKTKKALAKRIKVSANLKIIRHQAGKSHLLSSKNRKRKRRLSQSVTLTKKEKRLRKLIPYY